MSRVGEIRWHRGSFQQCVGDSWRVTTWVSIDPAWLDWKCIPSAWVKRRGAP